MKLLLFAAASNTCTCTVTTFDNKIIPDTIDAKPYNDVNVPLRGATQPKLIKTDGFPVRSIAVPPLVIAILLAAFPSPINPPLVATPIKEFIVIGSPLAKTIGDPGFGPVGPVAPVLTAVPGIPVGPVGPVDPVAPRIPGIPS